MVGEILSFGVFLYWEKKMNRKIIDPKQQFSKWLARSGAIYWIIYNTLLLALIFARPEVAMPCVYLAIIVSVVMVFHVIMYTKNSLGEKLILAALNRTQMEINVGGKASGDDNHEEVAEEGGNG